MAYIPVIVAAAQPSARAKELSRAIVQLVGEYRKNEPVTTDQEVQQAIQLAARELVARNRMDPETKQLARVIMLIVAITLCLVGVAAALWFSGTIG